MVKLFGHYVSTRSVLLALIELVAAVCTFYVAKYLTVDFVFEESREIYAEQTFLITFSFVSLVVAASLGLNNKDIYSDKRRFASTLVATAVVVYFVMAVLISVSELMLESAANLRLHYAIALLGIVLFVGFVFAIRSLMYSLLNLEHDKRQVLVVGIDERSASLQNFKSTARGPYEIVGYIPVGGGDRVSGEASDLQLGAPKVDPEVLADCERFMQFIGAEDVDEIVVASKERRGLPLTGLLEARFSGVSVTDFSGFLERQTGQLDIDNIDQSWLIFSNGFRSNWQWKLVKRGFDIFVSSLLLLLTLPITILAALAIRLEGPGPIFYRQERVGLNGRVIRIVKFRSMSIDAEKDGVARWAQANDSRVTRVGKFLRKTRIDEIPQTYNVLNGDMSLVGPRPERPVFVDDLTTKLPYYADRHRVKPGITGWAQINYSYGASDEDAKAKLAYDLYYVKNWDLFLDIVILFQTVRVVFWGEGAR